MKRENMRDESSSVSVTGLMVEGVDEVTGVISHP